MYLRHLFAYEEVARRLPADAVVLDVGCGEGYGTNVLARAGLQAEGIDLDGGSIAHATAAYGRDTCRFQIYDGISIPHPSNTFDAVVSFQVIEHVVNETRFVAEAARMVRSGGLCVITTPNRCLRLAPGERPWNRYHIREYSPSGLCELLASHFSRVEVLGIAGDEEAQAHELERLTWVRRTVARDPMGLRRLLPEGAKRRVLSLLRGAKGQRGSSDSVATWSTDRYRVIPDAGAGLDLFAVCTR
ncbi:MAG: class I SAM-dependent methyltransferase [Gemmatimonadota bacterium]|nr:class I SAM-dependent methyltransferase [Gemmatimonadota bacterium]